jgi:hypothetical protein
MLLEKSFQKRFIAIKQLYNRPFPGQEVKSYGEEGKETKRKARA